MSQIEGEERVIRINERQRVVVRNGQFRELPGPRRKNKRKPKVSEPAYESGIMPFGVKPVQHSGSPAQTRKGGRKYRPKHPEEPQIIPLYGPKPQKSTRNEHKINGLTPSEHLQNGYSLNGHAQNGHLQNGHISSEQTGSHPRARKARPGHHRKKMNNGFYNPHQPAQPRATIQEPVAPVINSVTGFEYYYPPTPIHRESKLSECFSSIFSCFTSSNTR